MALSPACSIRILHKISPQWLNISRKIAAEQTVEAITDAMAGLRDRSSHIDLLTQIKIPVLFILGKSDSRMPILKIMAQAGLTAHAEMLLLENVGHMGFAENPN